LEIAQLTNARIRAPKKAETKPAMRKPLTKYAVAQKSNPFKISPKSPRVIMFIGSVIKLSTGFTKRFNAESMRVAKRAVLKSDTDIPETTYGRAITTKEITINFIIIFI
jgi:hypothetical protein